MNTVPLIALNRSTIAYQLITERHLAEAAYNHESMDLISFDFSQAFDRVPLNKFLMASFNRGVSGRALGWIFDGTHSKSSL